MLPPLADPAADMPSEPLSRDAALAKVRALLHGDEARATMPMALRHELDTAIVLYGHAVGMEAINGFYEAIRQVHGEPVADVAGLRVVGSLDAVTGGSRG
jgi:hypothetical protein